MIMTGLEYRKCEKSPCVTKTAPVHAGKFTVLLKNLSWWGASMLTPNTLLTLRASSVGLLDLEYFLPDVHATLYKGY